MYHFSLEFTRAILLLIYLISFVLGKYENSLQNNPHFHLSFPTNHQHHLNFNTKRSPIYNESNHKIVNEGHQQPNNLLGTPEAAQAVVAIVQAVNGNNQQNHQSSSETIRSNSNNGMVMSRRCTYFENGEMRCVSRGDILDNISGLVNQAVSLANQFGGLTGLMGLMGLKGIAGLILPALCLFLLKFLLILLPLKLLIPIPIITFPVAGRQNTGFAEIEEKIASYLRQFISNGDNMEKNSPRVNKLSTKEKNRENSLKINKMIYKKPIDKFTNPNKF